MELSKQVTSLELSKKLKDLGVIKGALFFWGYPCCEEDSELTLDYHENLGTSLCAAYTVAELGKIIMEGQSGKQMQFHADVAVRGGYMFDAEYWGIHLCYLLENKLI